MPGNNNDGYELVVVGGGAAGFFGAITYAEANPGAKVAILEKGMEVLGKVKISGGGRCNVTHACFEPRDLSRHYPRGGRSLIGPFHRWGPAETMGWFEGRSVPLKVEADGRVFPCSDRSQSIIDCLLRAADQAGVRVMTGSAVERVEREEGGFQLALAGGESLWARRILMASGGIRNGVGAKIAAGLGHDIRAAAPSLFTFRIDDPRLRGLQGLSVAEATARVPSMKLSSRGAVLVTHWGLSGPGILKLSAWGARELHDCGYRFELLINWCGDKREDDLMGWMASRRESGSRRLVVNDAPPEIPARLWKRLAEAAGAHPELRWAHLERATAEGLARQVTSGRFQVDGKSTNKDEFVTCGGVDLKGVDMRTMESRGIPGLYFAGEILDIDGITGGFNFQSAWTTGWIAGEAMAMGTSGR